MAVDKEKTKQLIESVNATFDTVASALEESKRQWIKEKVLGAALGEIEKLVVESRPPVLYIMGRSGHGKSSLINALAKREVAKTDDVRPCTVGVEPYFITFSEFYSEWHVIDSRGIFETTQPDGAPDANALDQVKADVAKYRPDVILHVVAAPETRTLENDFKAFAEVQAVVRRELGAPPPAVMVVNKIDVMGNPRQWPLEEHPQKASIVKELLDYVAKDALGGTPKRYDLNHALHGYTLEDADYVGLIPVCALPGEDVWNVATLSSFIGEHLPESAQLDFYQAQQRKEQLRRVSSSITARFSSIAGLIGTSPVPISDIAVLTPLQSLMVAFIAGLSCRQMSVDAVTEFATASGVNVGAAFGVREIARQALKFLPVGGNAASGVIAAGATYGIGKSAEAYFFNGEVKKPVEFVKQWWASRSAETDAAA